MNPFSFATTAQILCESGSAARLGELCRERDAQRVLIVTDPGITKIGLLDSILPAMAKAQVSVEVFDQVEADPPEHVVLEAVAQARNMQAELIIGFGGGSSMDVAKLVALLAHPDGRGLADPATRSGAARCRPDPGLTSPCHCGYRY